MNMNHIKVPFLGLKSSFIIESNPKRFEKKEFYYNKYILAQQHKLYIIKKNY